MKSQPVIPVLTGSVVDEGDEVGDLPVVFVALSIGGAGREELYRGEARNIKSKDKWEWERGAGGIERKRSE